MGIYKVPCYWEMYGYITVEANSPEEAQDIVEEDKDDYALPYPADYVGESFHVDRDVPPRLLCASV